MKSVNRLTFCFFLFASTLSWAQPQNAPVKKQPKVVVITGVRFAYPLVQKWIDDYSQVANDVQVIIESRGTNDPTQYDILIDAYEHDDQRKENREYIYIARYAVLPVANSKSDFSKTYAEKGLNKELIKQIFFNDIYADKDNEQKVKSPYTVYTRLQRAGSPIVFAKYYGYEQKDIKGKTVAGSDEHLLKAILRDSVGISYLPLSLIYDRATGNPISGLSVLPVDLNGNGRVNDDEKFYSNLSTVVRNLEEKSIKEINNIPIEYLHFSIDKQNSSPEAIAFLQWVIQNKLTDLTDFGFLQPEPSRFEKDKFVQFASKRGQ